MRFPQVGEIFASKYMVDELLGSGGFSRVYRATQTELGRPVAIKVLQPVVGRIHDDDQRHERLKSLSTRFEREARMVSQLRCPHTITMYDYGRTDDGLLYMSLEYVDGLTLTELVDRDGPIEADRAFAIARQVLLSLYEAHELGMLHRDIKPQNIMVFDHLGQRDQAKLLDFGIVKLVNSEASRENVDLTADDTIVGTPRYMAPEYIRGEALTPASDIYSLGLVLYELLRGERAIKADSSIQIIGAQLERDSFYLPPVDGLAPYQRDVVNRMLEKDLERRYGSVQEILNDLDAMQPTGSFAAIPGEPIEDNEPGADRSRRGVLVFAAVAALLFAIGAGAAIWAASADPSEIEEREMTAAKAPEAEPSLEITPDEVVPPLPLDRGAEPREESSALLEGETAQEEPAPSETDEVEQEQAREKQERATTRAESPAKAKPRRKRRAGPRRTQAHPAPRTPAQEPPAPRPPAKPEYKVRVSE